MNAETYMILFTLSTSLLILLGITKLNDSLYFILMAKYKSVLKRYFRGRREEYENIEPYMMIIFSKFYTELKQSNYINIRVYEFKIQESSEYLDCEIIFKIRLSKGPWKKAYVRYTVPVSFMFLSVPFADRKDFIHMLHDVRL